MDFRAMGGLPRDPNTGNMLDTHEINSLFSSKGAESPELTLNVLWDFGRAPHEAKADARTVETAAPWVSGAWDGKTTYNLFALAKRVKHTGTPGSFLPAQWQPEGTCVGRGCSGLLNHLQFSRILGTPQESIEWKPVSHAWCYAGARMQYNMLHDRSYGAVGKGALEWCHAKGVCYQQEVNDINYRSDVNAGNWAYSGIPSTLIPLGADNLVDDSALVTTCQQVADLMSVGGGITIASNQGFTMARDSEGFCKPQGNWAHQMFLGSVFVNSRGRRGFGCCQSWDQNVPGGPTLENHPDNVFGIDWDTVQVMLNARDSMGAWVFHGWNKNLDWGALS